MDDLYEDEVRRARPRRQVHPPTRYEDYTTDLPNLNHSPEPQRVSSAPVSSSPYQLLSSEMQRTQSENRNPRCSSLSEPHHASSTNSDLPKFYQEKFPLQQSQQHAEGIAVSRNPFSVKEDWPLPPPLSDEFKPVSSSTLDRITSLMNELLILRKEALTAQPSISAYTTPMPRPAVAHPVTPSACEDIYFQSTKHPAPPTTLPPFASPQSINPRLPKYASSPEIYYRGPQPTIPKLIHRDPGEFACLKLALENLLPPNSSELFKYQILLDHLQLEDAQLIADAYLHSPTPYTDTMQALDDKFGQPHQLALKRIATVLDSPDIQRGDVAAFDKFSLQIQSLVGMLKTLGSEGEVELQCGSHVARLLSKLPPEQRADFRRCMFSRSGKTYTLHDLATWLKHESWCQDFDGQLTPIRQPEACPPKRSVSVLHGGENRYQSPPSSPTTAKSPPYCAFCDIQNHHLSRCPAISQLSKDQLTDWIKTNKRCWRCARPHLAAQCNLKKPCSLCQGRHLQVLHEINTRPPESHHLMQCKSKEKTPQMCYTLIGRQRVVASYSKKDNAPTRSCTSTPATWYSRDHAPPHNTPRYSVLQGTCVSFTISSRARSNIKFRVNNAFTAARIDLAHHTYPVDALQKKYKHLQGLPLKSFRKVKPLLLIGSDHPHLITPTKPVRLGPPGGPAAICTRLGWTLQGPSGVNCQSLRPQQCLVTSVQFPVASSIQTIPPESSVSSVTPAKNPVYYKHSVRNLQESSPLEFHGAAHEDSCPPAETFPPVKTHTLKKTQLDCLPEKHQLLKMLASEYLVPTSLQSYVPDLSQSSSFNDLNHFLMGRPKVHVSLSVLFSSKLVSFHK
ncbi:hypothetical protein WMY93_004647 [Mugilogobius chulae]|uniref:Uncharacterized protein n=1 Tax=Mugilogobius chulae TaxID=88201 RepID=A0AAW0PSP9_9GOBI